MPAAKGAARRTKPSTARSELAYPEREGALAILLMSLARQAGAAGIVHVASSESRAERLAGMIWALAGDVDAIVLPPWDCLPYDRLSPSPGVQGLRIAVLARLGEPHRRPWIVLTTPDALLQRLPPQRDMEAATRRLRVGDTVDLAALAADLVRIGYKDDARVDEPGEFAVRGQVVDIFPAGYALPVRIDHEDGRITAIASFDAATQRKTDEFDALALRPVSEAVLPPGDQDEGSRRAPGLEHRLPELYPELSTLFDHAPDATFVFEPKAEDRRDVFRDQVRDAYASRLKLREGAARPLPPERLYLDDDEFATRLAGHATVSLVLPDDEDCGASVPRFALAANPGTALATFVDEQVAAGRRVVLAGSTSDLPSLSRRAERLLRRPPVPVPDWSAVETAAPGSLLALAVEFDHGFVLAEEAVAVVAASDLLGSRAGTAASNHGGDLSAFGEEEFRIGDAVIHLDHGVGVLEGIETVQAGDAEPSDTIRLDYAGGAKLMVPISDIHLMWRYGSAPDGVSLDRLDGESWPKRRAKVEREIEAAARNLARVVAERKAVAAPKIVPPRRDYERFVARFPFTETADQHAAVADILADLGSGHVMNRLVCGDVGFGKTEVALRAAAAAALAGRQVAIVAPTTVLVRQHLQTFRRRFADLGIEVAHLSRLVRPAEAKDVKAGLADGRIRVVIGTHALAGRGVAFQDLGLLVIDEEQRFGAADKAKLRALGRAVHLLTLTATPIPRTMQSALVGLQEVSVLATPPAERQPVRTVVSPFDEVAVREALLREQRRGGQSFVVCPQIEDLEPMAARLRRLVPELETFTAHGKLPALAIDDVMVRFADGEGDVLLATNIIESGLDVPRANTIVVWRADRFGLAQLHQLRGRVGRGRARGAAYLVSDPETELPDATVKRLRTLERLDRLGAGFAISSEDLDQRGAGDLMGDTQAGHVRLIGAGLYRRLLERALRAARGDGDEDEWSPDLNLGLSGRLPDDYVPEPEVRLNLYARIARATDLAAEAQLADEIEDRFGPLPEPVRALLALARLRRLCRAAGIARVDAGPQAIALTFKERDRHVEAVTALVAASDGELAWRGERLVQPASLDAADARIAAAEALIERVRAASAKRAPAADRLPGDKRKRSA